MSGNSSQSGKRADTFYISDHPHTHYFESGKPVLKQSGCGWGNIILKEIDFTTLRCPECFSVGHYDENSNPFCENCGYVLRDLGVPRTDDGEPVVIDAKSAERIGGQD